MKQIFNFIEIFIHTIMKQFDLKEEHNVCTYRSLKKADEYFCSCGFKDHRGVSGWLRRHNEHHTVS